MHDSFWVGSERKLDEDHVLPSGERKVVNIGMSALELPTPDLVKQAMLVNVDHAKNTKVEKPATYGQTQLDIMSSVDEALDVA